jgi:hypothetical protein
MLTWFAQRDGLPQYIWDVDVWDPVFDSDTDYLLDSEPDTWYTEVDSQIDLVESSEEWVEVAD